MDRTDSRLYSINDFREWDNAKTLELAPRFQRRQVWSLKARSYLIDTVLRGLPMPKVFMRQHIDDAGRTIREIVDGQQRLRTILAYQKNAFSVMPVHGGDEFGGKYYGDLPQKDKDNFLNYNISVDILIGATNIDVLDIFARLNTYGVRLNTQELINAKYFGHFKQTVYGLGHDFDSFWIANGILSETDIARMLEAELSGELVIAMLAGIQSRKVVEDYYRKYDDSFTEKPKIIEQFKSCMDLIGEITENRLRTSNFSSKHLFYSLYCAIYDLRYGLLGSETRKILFNHETIPRVRATLWNIDALFEEKYEFLREDVLKFVDVSTRHTTDLSARQARHQYLVSRIMGDIESRRP